MNLDMLKSTTITATTGVTLGENAANKTRLHKIVLRKNGTAVTAGIAGFGNEDASPAAKTRTYTGSTTADVVIELDGIVADKGALVVTASIADLVDVTWSAVGR